MDASATGRARAGRRPRRRIGRRLVLWFLASTCAIVVISGWSLYRLTSRALEAQMTARLVAVAQLVSEGIDMAPRLRPGLEGGLLHTRLRRRLVRARDAVGARRIFVFDPEGRSLVDSEPGVSIGTRHVELQLDRSEMEAVWQGRTAHSILFRGDDGAYYKTGYAPVRADTAVVAGVGVQIGARFVGTIRSFSRSAVALGLAGIGLCLVVGLVLARSLTGPIRRLVRSARVIGRGDLETTVALSSDDELGYLAQAMDEMRARIQGRDQELRQMLAGVAHEIRNPLGGIELYAGVIAGELPEGDERRAHIQRVIGEVRNLNRVITGFLEFARPSQASPSAIDLVDAVRAAVFAVSPEMEAAGVVSEMDLPEGLWGTFDPDHLRQVMTNLIKNATQAMGAGGRLKVSGRREGPEAVLEVSDTGPGLAPDTAERIFEPFYTTREQGSGLGLSVVRQSVEQNGGSIEVHSVPGDGATFRLRMPGA